MRTGKIVLLLVVAALVAAFFAFDLGHYLTLEFFRSQRDAIEAYHDAHHARSIAAALPAITTWPGALKLTA